MTDILAPVAVVAAIGLVAGVILTLAVRFFTIPVDLRSKRIRMALPGVNCGACGCAGCDEYADRLVHDGMKTNLCTPGGAEVSRRISHVLGTDFLDVTPVTAEVRCAGTPAHTTKRSRYENVGSCAAAASLYGGDGACRYGCVGLGDCVRVCQYNAISIVDGVALVDKRACTGCGMCADACPKHLVAMLAKSVHAYVACSSRDSGGVARKACAVGCIGCKRCEKACDFGAITVTDNLAVLDPHTCTSCGECVAVCPTASIRRTFSCPIATGK